MEDRLKDLCLGALQRSEGKWLTITDLIPLLNIDIKDFREGWFVGSIYNALQSLTNEARVESHVVPHPDRPVEGTLFWRAAPVRWRD